MYYGTETYIKDINLRQLSDMEASVSLHVYELLFLADDGKYVAVL